MKYIPLQITTFEELMASKAPMTPKYFSDIFQAGYISRKVARKLAKQFLISGYFLKTRGLFFD